MANVNGTPGNDTLVSTGDPNGDVFNGGGGNDVITGGAGDDTVAQFPDSEADSANLGGGSDTVIVFDDSPTNYRLTFTSSEVGNGSATDAGTQINQDGGLAVRFQAEDETGALVGPISRFDDEGITFQASTVANGDGTFTSNTFDVRDLVSGAQRGQFFEVVTLGTSAADTLTARDTARPHYINAGQGADSVTGGAADDFLVGGAGDDTLSGAGGNDSFIGGGGNDTVSGGAGNDRVASFNVATDGADTVNLGEGDDEVVVSGAAQVRVTFATPKVGDGATDTVFVQSENGSDGLTGGVSTFDDEGITFTAATGTTFDVREQGSDVRRGVFNTVTLGTSGADSSFSFSGATAYGGTGGADYINGGEGDDQLAGGDGADNLVGAVGNDNLNGGAGRDQLVGAAGNDTIDSVDRPSSIFGAAIAPERDIVDGGAGDDMVTGGRLDQLLGGSGTDFLLVNFDFNGPFTTSPPAARPAVTLILDANGTGTANDGTYVSGFESLNFNLTDSADTVNTGNVRASLSGNDGNDVLTTGSGTVQGFSFGGPAPLIGDELSGGAGDDVLSSGDGNDTLNGGTGSDFILGGAGDDILSVDVANDGADQVNLGAGDDTVRFDGFDVGQIRVTLNTANVGDGQSPSAGEVVVQREDAKGNLIGDVDGFDDEGIRFLSGTQGFTFDVRETSGSQRGVYDGVVLGSAGADSLTFFPPIRGSEAYFYAAGQGDDIVTAGSGNDALFGGLGNDTLTGGGGADQIVGGGGDDIVFQNVATDGGDRVDLGGGADVVNLSGATQVRLTFTSAEVGNGVTGDGGTLTNQDRGLAVRVQGEDATGALTGDIARYDDEGTTFLAATGTTLDVRDLVSGVARGDQFGAAVLGTRAADTLTATDVNRAYYFNAGQGADVVTGGTANDFLVGGAGDDILSGGAGRNSFIGGAGADRINGGADVDTIAAFNVTTDGADNVNLGGGFDVVNVSASAPTNVRLTFTSSEVGNGNALDARTMMGQDGGLAVRLQAETAGEPGGSLSRFDDEGITFVGGAGVTFDVRDLVSGAQRGETFSVVVLGGSGAEVLGADLAQTSNAYINGGGGADTLRGFAGDDFLVGGAGSDSLNGAGGNDRFIGGGGADQLIGGAGADTFIFAAVTDSGSGGLDRISDFLSSEGDVISLTAIDADTATAGDQAFTFVSAFSGMAGQAVLTQGDGLSTLQLDVNGDSVADFTLEIAGAVSPDQGFLL